MAGPISSTPSAQAHSASFERLTDRLRIDGLRHPEAAAAALTARGNAGLSFGQFCGERQIIPDLWQQAEEGWLARQAVERLLAIAGKISDVQ